MLEGQFKVPRAHKLSQAELDEVAKLDAPKINILAAWTNKTLTCSHCRRCTNECEVLNYPKLDVGTVEREFGKIMALDESERNDAVIQLVQDQPNLFVALRRCCFCGNCTSECRHHVLAADRMREWRELFFNAGYLPEEKMVLVDNEWNIFSAYRAIYGIGYPEFVSLDYAATQPGLVDTLFFPGCSLVSYTPELVRAVGNWLSDQGISWALSDACCGSPLMSAGRFDRAAALREGIKQKMVDAGIKRIITVCPGCGEEFAPTMANDIDIIPLPEVLLEYGRKAKREGENPGFSPAAGERLTFFDSCHDRHDQRHGKAIRKLMAEFVPGSSRTEMLHHGATTLCCGAGGAVAAYDPDICDRKVWRVIDEARDTQAQTLVTMCPTCAYTIAQACLNADPERGVNHRHYLELLFGITVDWKQIFANLNDMWTGEYGPWLQQQFF